MGRPPALDAVKKGQICAMISLGCSRNAAARYVGCATTTIRHTAMHNREFRAQLRRAELNAEIAPLKSMHAAKSWRAAAWLLERTHPAQYARRPPDVMSNEDFGEFVGCILKIILQEVPSVEVRQRIKRRVLENIEWEKKQIRAAADPLLDGRRRKGSARQRPPRLSK